MNILAVIRSVDPQQGGPVEALMRIQEELQKRGHRPEVVTCDDPAASFVRGFPLPVHALGPARSRFAFTSKLAPWLRTNAPRFDVAVLHGLWNYAVYGAWRGLRGRVPFVNYAHGMLDPWFNTVQPVKRWAKQLYWLGAQGRILREADAVLFTTDEERRRARHSFAGYAYRERLVAYGAADPPDGGEQPQAAAFAARTLRLGSNPYFLFLSRLHPKKGCDLLLGAFTRLAPDHPDLHLVIAGPDQVGLAASLRAQAGAAGLAGRVHFPGMLEGHAKWGAYRGACALVLPSHQENFGIVVAEAMACSVPVLISDKVNIWREVAASGGGLVEPDTAEGTTQLLHRFLGLSPAERLAMGQHARASFEAHFSVTGAADALEQALVSAAAGFRG